MLDLISTSIQLAAGSYGAGRHVYYISESDLAKASLFGTVGVPFSQLAMALPKIAAAGVLVRIAGPQAPKWIKYYLYTITAILTLLSSIYSIFLFVQCTPAFALWTNVPDAHCWSPLVIEITGIVSSVFSVFVDLNLAIYPIVIMRRLQMELRKKISICILMGLGVTATICAAFKIPHLRDQTEPDITWAIIPLACWTSAEVNLVMIAASVPLLRPLWLWLTGKPYNHSTRGSERNVKRTSRRGFKSFGSRKDTRNEMTIDIGLEETMSPREDGVRALMTPPMNAHGGIRVEKSIVVSHEEV